MAQDTGLSKIDAEFFEKNTIFKKRKLTIQSQDYTLYSWTEPTTNITYISPAPIQVTAVSAFEESIKISRTIARLANEHPQLDVAKIQEAETYTDLFYYITDTEGLDFECEDTSNGDRFLVGIRYGDKYWEGLGPDPEAALEKAAENFVCCNYKVVSEIYSNATGKADTNCIQIKT